jgi:hypothetical protein
MKNSTKVIFYICFIALVVALFGAMTFHFRDRGDFGDHLEWIRQMAQDGYMYKIPHSLYHKLVVAVRALLPANLLVWMSPWIKQVYDLKSFEISSIILITLVYVSVAVILVKRMLTEWEEYKSDKLIWWVGLAALVIMLAAPVFIFTLPYMYKGYATGNRFDSPTFILAKPFMILTFYGVVNNLFKKWRWTNALWMVGFIMCVTLAKPNFTITFLPALALLLLVVYLRKWKEVNWLYIIFPLGLTALIVLVGQFLIAYSGARGDRIIFAPLEAVMIREGSIPNLLFYLVMSFLFPLAAIILYWKTAKKDLSIQLALANMGVALAYVLLLGEEINMAVTNFWNCIQFATFVSFMVSVIFFGKQILIKLRSHERLTWREWTTGSLLAAHFICGMVYYVASITYMGIVKM